MTVDPRLISAIALFLIGFALVGFVVRVWMTHPVNRVFLVGKFVTEDGLRVMLNNLPTVFVLGLAALTMGAAKVGYAMRWAGGPEYPADFLGTLEAIFLIWAAGCVFLAVVRLCRKG